MIYLVQKQIDDCYILLEMSQQKTTPWSKINPHTGCPYVRGPTPRYVVMGQNENKSQDNVLHKF